jgi:hypothetical protein
MKKLFAILLLCSCSIPIDKDKFIKQAHDVCTCHRGVDVLLVDNNSYSLTCKDGSKFEGVMSRDLVLYAECNK